jgi:hypothetical protein
MGKHMLYRKCLKQPYADERGYRDCSLPPLPTPIWPTPSYSPVSPDDYEMVRSVVLEICDFKSEMRYTVTKLWPCHKGLGFLSY